MFGTHGPVTRTFRTSDLLQGDQPIEKATPPRRGELGKDILDAIFGREGVSLALWARYVPAVAIFSVALSARFD